MAKTKAKEKVDDLELAEDIGRGLQDKSTEPREADYRRMWLRVQSGELSRVKAAKELGVSRGGLWRWFEKFQKEADAGEKTETFHVETPEIEADDFSEAREKIFPVGVQHMYVHQLDNTRYQPRALISASEDLTHDIRVRRGNIYPVLVQRSTLAVVDGHRRVDAVLRINAELPEEEQLLVKVDLQDLSDAESALLAYQANVLSSPLSEGERDKWVYRLMDEFGWDTKKLMEVTGLAETTLSNIRRVYEKSAPSVREKVESGELSTGVAKAIVSLDSSAQARLARRAAGGKMSVRQVEEEVKHLRIREGFRGKLEAYLAPQAETTVELKRKKGEFRDAEQSWAYQVITAVFGASFHIVDNVRVTPSDVREVAKKLKISLVVKEPEPELCDTCQWRERDEDRGPRCFFASEKFPKARVCEMHLRSDNFLRPRNSCAVCGGFLLDIAVELIEFDTHKACLVVETLKKGLSGLCETCGSDCSILRGVVEDHQGRFLRKVTVTACVEYTKRPDMEALKADPLGRAMAYLMKVRAPKS